MTLAPARSGAVPPTLTTPDPGARATAGPPDDQLAHRRRPVRLPAWPLTGLLLLYPLWWALGLGVLIFPLVALPMAA